MSLWLIAPALLQGILMMADEFHFHRARGLPRWERLGHPIDTLFLLLPLSLCLIFQPTPAAQRSFFALSVFSSLVITKDEWVHARECGGGEQWVHALLFAAHPLVLLAAWRAWIAATPGARFFLVAQSVAVGAFLIHQIFYWNLLKRASND